MNDDDYSSCGTEGEYVQNKFYNGIIVGGVDIQYSGVRCDDTMYDCSSWENPPYTDRELPEISAPALQSVCSGEDEEFDNLDSAGYDYKGTSASAAIVGGVVVLMIKQNSLLQYWPEAIKAITMVTAWNDPDGLPLSLSSSVDNKDGAGEIDARLAVILSATDNKYPDSTSPLKERTGTCQQE